MRRRSPASELSGLERAGTMQWVVLVGGGAPSAWILSFEGWVGNVALEANRGSQLVSFTFSMSMYWFSQESCVWADTTPLTAYCRQPPPMRLRNGCRRRCGCRCQLRLPAAVAAAAALCCVGGGSRGTRVEASIERLGRGILRLLILRSRAAAAAAAADGRLRAATADESSGGEAHRFAPYRTSCFALSCARRGRRSHDDAVQFGGGADGDGPTGTVASSWRQRQSLCAAQALHYPQTPDAKLGVSPSDHHAVDVGSLAGHFNVHRGRALHPADHCFVRGDERQVRAHHSPSSLTPHHLPRVTESPMRTA